MKSVAVLIDSYAHHTALESIDLALAVGLLDIPVGVFLRGSGWRHLQNTDATVRGRWRTLMDYCPAQVWVEACDDASNGAPQTVGDDWVITPQWLAPAAFAQALAACTHVLQG